MHKLEGLQGQISNSAKLSSIGAISLDMAHQIKNPLTILLGRLENLLEGVAEESPSRHHLDSTITAGWRIQELTQNFASIGNQKPIGIDVNDLLNDAFAIAGIRNRGRIQTPWDCQEDLPKISGNPVLLREALSNIFSNAMEAVNPDGLIATSASGADGTVVVRISNDGAGIPQDVMDHRFEPFQPTKANGSGLGLFAAKHIVEMHRGSVSVENNEARGTSVRISLPAHLQESRESQRDDSDIPLPISSR